MARYSIDTVTLAEMVSRRHNPWQDCVPCSILGPLLRIQLNSTSRIMRAPTRWFKAAPEYQHQLRTYTSKWVWIDPRLNASRPQRPQDGRIVIPLACPRKMRIFQYSSVVSSGDGQLISSTRKTASREYYCGWKASYAVRGASKFRGAVWISRTVNLENGSCWDSIHIGRSSSFILSNFGPSYSKHVSTQSSHISRVKTMVQYCPTTYACHYTPHGEAGKGD